MRNPRFHKLVDDLKALHDKKNADYASDADPYSNFTPKYVEGFTNPQDQVFAALIGIKLERLKQLTQPGRVPNNESVQDTRRDLATYAAIWASYYEEAPVPEAPVVIGHAIDPTAESPWQHVATYRTAYAPEFDPDL
jgi:hypothetical protein